MFRRIFYTISVIVFGLNTTFSNADTEKKPEWVPEVSGEVTFETQYIWRGQTLGSDPVVQPGASVSSHGFTFSVWGNYDTGDPDRFTEWDYIFDYTFTMGDFREKLGGDEAWKFLDPISISNGYTYYTFPNLSGGDYDSHEYYVGVGYDVLLQPFVTFYYDFDSGDGAYWEFGGSHSFEVEGIALDLGITTGYNVGQWGYDSSFSNVLFSSEVGIPLFKYFTISPNVNYSVALDEQYDSEFYAGLKIGFTY